MAFTTLFAVLAVPSLPWCHAYQYEDVSRLGHSSGFHAEDTHTSEQSAGLEPSGETLVFGVHHKTGTELAHDASDCFDAFFKHKEVKMFTCSELPANERAVHFTRNPVNLALSAYLYHKEEGEAWTKKHGSAKIEVGDDSYAGKRIKGEETYTQFLRRVPPRVGIRAEIFRLLKKHGEFDQIKAGEKNCRSSQRCIEICLEDFTVSSKSFDSSWERITRFMGKHMTPSLHSCLAKQDLHRHSVSQTHVTSNDLSEHEYNILRKMVWQVDNLAFGGSLKRLSHGRLQCGGASELLRTTVAANPTFNFDYGGGYKEWLIEEQFSKHWGV